MDQATPALRDLARHLLALEVNQTEHLHQEVQTALRVIEKLRSYLFKMVGSAGFQALLARAVVLATAEVGWLKVVRVQDDTTLQGFQEAAQQQPAKAVTLGSTALLAQLLGLLVTFIGEALTLRLVEDIWPGAHGEDENVSAKETSNE